MKLLITALLASFSIAGLCEELTGPAQVVDGDSIRIGDTEIRLYGIDAPEGRQLCLYQGDDWACGKTATQALKQIVGTGSIRCSWTHRDRYERALSTCYRKGYDIAQIMIDHGLALAYTQHSGKYIPDERQAKAERKGLWGAQFVAPWDWRRGVRLAGNEFSDVDCEIKGNVNSKGERIYHVKGWRNHAEIRLNAAQGDKCFRSVLDAELAGFRMPHYARPEK